jgi:GR25 family glycosyltransferase involved in LPS biosynthesis
MNVLHYIHSNLEIIIFFLLVSILSYLILQRSWEGFYTQLNGINRLDAIIYINLENRSDRKNLLMSELNKLDTDMSKVHKVSGVYMPKNGHKGCIQSHILALNMIKMNKWDRVLILEDDAELDMDPEVINNLINKSLEKLDKKHPDWNVIMLATANKVLDNKNNKNNQNNKNNKNKNNSDDSDSDDSDSDDSNNNGKSIPMKIYATNGKIVPLKIEKLKSATTSSAYIVKKSYVDTILNLFNNCNNNMSANKMTGQSVEQWALDQKWEELQYKDKWFCIDKDPIKQRAIWSTIQYNANNI